MYELIEVRRRGEGGGGGGGGTYIENEGVITEPSFREKYVDWNRLGSKMTLIVKVMAVTFRELDRQT